MPTGFTANVVNGKVTEFKDFALTCARAFGYFVSMREEPLEVPIPDEINSDDSYYVESLKHHQDKLAELQAMTADEISAANQNEYAELLKSHEDYITNVLVENKRISDMRQKVLAWTPPTSEHVQMKDFMLSQLDVSKHDMKYVGNAPQQFSDQEWYARQIQNAKKDIKYYQEEVDKNKGFVNKANEWLQALRKSLS